MLKPFSDRVSGLQPSAIREILKFTADPEVISFAAGNPAPEAFPVETIAKLSADIFREAPRVAEGRPHEKGAVPRWRPGIHHQRSTAGYRDHREDTLQRGRCDNLRGSGVRRLAECVQELRR